MAANTQGPSIFAPSGYVWVLKDIEARGQGGAAVELRLALNGLTLITLSMATGAVSAQWSGMAVVNPGESVSAYAAGNAFYYQISGYALTVASSGLAVGGDYPQVHEYYPPLPGPAIGTAPS